MFKLFVHEHYTYENEKHLKTAYGKNVIHL